MIIGKILERLYCLSDSPSYLSEFVAKRWLRAANAWHNDNLA
ncbi:uncharacterized protein METZ01_LOCUS373550, partial [marine metagenome]